MYKALALLAIVPSAFAHFLLNYPTSLGFDDDNEGNGPCGGFDVTFNANDTNVTVGGFSVATTTFHPQGSWLFRATLSTAEPFNWTNILPVVSQTGLGNFCLPALEVPSSFAGKRGVIQIIDDAVDGLLYQCAAVNFVEGVTSSVPGVCTNSSGVAASVTTQTAFSNTTSSTTSSAPAATSSHSGALKQAVGGALSFIPIAMLLL